MKDADMIQQFEQFIHMPDLIALVRNLQYWPDFIS